MTYETGDLILFDDVKEFGSIGLSYDKPYEVQARYSDGSFEIKDDDGDTRWIDVSKHEYVYKSEVSE